MANVRGTGGMKGRSVIVTFDPKRTVYNKDESVKGYYVTAELDQSLKNPDKVIDGTTKADSNPFIFSEEKDGLEGRKYISHNQYYSESQVQGMIEAAGKKKVELEDNKVAYGVEVDLTKNAQGALIVAKSIGPSKNPRFGAKTPEKQAAVTSAAKAFRDQQIEAKREATKEVSAEAVAAMPSVELDQPEV